ncbi:MAG: SIS domain-containing protein [Erysipelotrichaceae bacterium]|nr:SIS domain-containing protein [Erysipelotrichaceae bacterium]
MYKYAYMNKVQELMDAIYATQQPVIDDLAKRFADNIKNNRIIHVFGTGHSHMIGIELFCRAGGLGNVNALLDQDVLTSNGARRSGAMEKVSGVSDVIYDQYNIQKGDIMIITSNSGRNAMPIEMAIRAKKEGVYTIAMTNLKQSEKTSSRHPSGKRLFECVDCIIDSCVPEGDSMMTVGNVKTAPGSTVSGVIILNTIVNEALQILAAEGCELPVFQSQNVDGFNNDAIYAKYEDRVKHF